MIKKGSFSLNVMANYAGTVGTAVVQLMLVPLYLKLLGAESFGLVGFFLTLQAVLQLLDFGLSPAINREMARSAASGRDLQDFVKTLETIYWVAGAAIGLSLAAASGSLATHWIHVTGIPKENLRAAVALMGLTIAVQWPLSCYRGALLGLQKQALVNVLGFALYTISGLGSLAVLSIVSPTVTAFLIWRAAMAIGEVLIMRRVMWASIRSPADSSVSSRFRLRSVAGVWRFSAGMTVIGMTAVILTHMDKIILSKLLTMDLFGYYVLAASVANVLLQLSGPVFVASFPHLSELVAGNDLEAQRDQFHLGAQIVTVIVIPAAVVLAFFSHTVIALWTGNESLADRTSPVLVILAAGSVLNSFMVLPYALQLAHGWTKLVATINVLLVLTMIPYTVMAIRSYGLAGAASTWLVLNAVYLAIAAPMTFRRLLPGDGWRWLSRDVAIPLLGAVAAAGLVWAVLPKTGSTALMVTKLALASFLSYLAALATAGSLRQAVWRGASRFLPRRSLAADARRVTHESGKDA